VTGYRTALERARGFVRRSLVEPEAPLLAVEVRKTGLGVVRLERQAGRTVLASAASADLPPGVLDLSLTEPGIRDEEALGRALAGLLERAGALREGTAALVLPDPVGRISVLPAPELLGKRGKDLEELARFRLRRSVPFEVRDAQVAVGLPPRGGPETVVVAAIYRPILEAFEGLLARQGLRPGLVELSSLALLSGLEPWGGDRLLVNWDEGYASLVLARDGWPLLVRTLTEAAASPDALRREVANTLLYHRERLGGSELTGAWVRSAVLPAADAVALLHEPLGLSPVVLDPWAAFGGGEEQAGQVLAGALAAAGRGALRRAA
jgi:hypothetical protein